MQRTNHYRILASISVIIFSILACRPVITIGWLEFLILTVLIILLIGPPIYRFIRRLEKGREQKKK